MKESELVGKVHSSVYHQCQKRGYATHYVDTAKCEELKKNCLSANDEKDGL